MSKVEELKNEMQKAFGDRVSQPKASLIVEEDETNVEEMDITYDVFLITIECTKDIKETFYAIDAEKESIEDRFRHDMDISLYFGNKEIILKGDTFVRLTCEYIEDEEFLATIMEDLLTEGVLQFEEVIQ